MLCKQCGKELKDAAVFCPDCGASQFAYREDQVHNGSVGVGEAIVLFFRNYTNFSGRASRSEYWWVFLFHMLLNLFIISVISTIFPPLGLLCSMALIVPGLALFWRRMHDTGKSGAYLFIAFIPIAGWILLLVQLCLPSEGDNKWGPGPITAPRGPVNTPKMNGVSQPAESTVSQPVPVAESVAAVSVKEEEKTTILFEEKEEEKTTILFEEKEEEKTTILFEEKDEDKTAILWEEPAKKEVTDGDILLMVRNHEPFYMSTPDAKRMADRAVCEIIPAYEETENLAEAMLQCEPREIKEKIASADNDTLFVVYKALDFYMSQGANAQVLGMVKQYVFTTLKSRF